MITNLEALKKLYAALGGQVENLADTATNADVIDAIAEVVTTAIMPGVTAADNGKVLMVQNGAWVAASIDELPEVTVEDNGKILKVVNAQWAVATNE
jgi:hypothetical protein